MKLNLQLGCWVLLFWSGLANAQQSQDFPGYTVHYNALNTSELEPAIAQAYGIQRSSSRAILNITVLRKPEEGEPIPVAAEVSASLRNLTGQIRSIDMRRIDEGNEAIYYIGEFRVNNMEMFDFTVAVLPEGATDALEIKFRQQFYTE